jgi:HEAT repeats
MRWRIFLSLLLAAALAGPALAGLFSKKPTKPSPTERVPELLSILKNDGDENKRQDAAEELRQYDLAIFPQIVPALIEALQNDAKPSVRSEAAQSLGKLRPVLQPVRLALEQARDKDSSMRVRFQARSSLLGLHWTSGWHGNTPEPPVQSKEPPVADNKGKNAPPMIQTQPPVQGPANLITPPLPGPVIGAQTQTQSPPPRPTPAPTNSGFFRLMPSGPAKATVKTTEPPLAPPLPTPTPPPVPTQETATPLLTPPPSLQPVPTGPELGPAPE